MVFTPNQEKPQNHSPSVLDIHNEYNFPVYYITDKLKAWKEMTWTPLLYLGTKVQ